MTNEVTVTIINTNHASDIGYNLFQHLGYFYVIIYATFRTE